MEPLSPQDPLRQLLQQARDVQVRPNFTQNVVRLARQTPQERGWLASLKAWWQENTALGGLSLAGGAAAALALAFVFMQPEQPASIALAPVPQTAPVLLDETPLPAETEAAWESSLHTEALLAVEDSSQLTDSEISFLLY